MTTPYDPVRQPRSERVAVRGVDYHVTRWGDARDPALFFLHGWGDTGSTIQFVVDALSDRWQVIAPDWRGFGRSTAVAGGYWFPDYVADLHELLAQLSPEEPARLVGHSMGANIAGLYAGVMPERVAAFVNAEGFGLADSDPEDAPKNYRRWIEASAVGGRFSIYASFDELVPRILKRSPRLSLDRAHFVAREWANRGADGVVRLRADPAHKLPNPVLYRRAEAAACWRQVKAPVLLVMGENTDFASGAKAWIDPDPERQPFRGAPRVVLPEAGHMLHFEAPEALARSIDDFFRDL